MPAIPDSDTENGNDNSSEFCMEKIEDIVQDVLKPADFEAHPFLVGWYNDLVGPKFALNYPPSTVALVLISGPEVFEKAVIPYLKLELAKDPDFSTIDLLDKAMKYYFQRFAEELQKRGYSPQPLHDFELYPNRKPKILVQTAAQVAGAVEYVFKGKLTSPEYLQEKLYAVTVHPRYGGWFAIRGVVILEGVEANLKPPTEPTLLPDENQRVLLMREFTHNWKSVVWRNVVPPEGGKTYSQDFIDYLDTPTEDRWKFIVERGYCQA